MRSRIGCLIEAPGLYENMTAYENLKTKCLFEEWKPEGIAYTAGDRVKYNEKLYKCLQAHT